MKASCCTCQRPPLREIGPFDPPLSSAFSVRAADSDNRTSPISAWRSGTAPQAWLKDWEERQRLQLQEHQEATALLVDSLREELLKRLDSLATTGRGLHAKTPPKEEDSRQFKVGLRRSTSEPTRMTPAVSGDASQALQTILDGTQSAMDMQMFVRGDRWRRMNTARPSQGEEAEEESKGGWQPVLAKIVHSTIFHGVIAILIIGYTADIGVQSSLEIGRALAGEEQVSFRWRKWTDLSFAIAFALELALRVCAEQRSFCVGIGRYWNTFDAVLVGASFIEVMDLFEFNLAFLRILRAVRSVRVIRVIRIFRFFRELRVMAMSIISCLVSLIWAFVLLLLVMYIFALVLLQGATNYLVTTDDVSPTLKSQLTEDFGSIGRTIYSLMLAISGGRSWGEYAEPYVTISPWYMVIFVLFIIFVIFGVLNILTGVFVESTHSLAHIDKELVIQEEISREESTINQMRNLFTEIDADGSGTITAKELTKNLSDPRVRAYFAVLQVDVSEAQGLFQLLDRDESGEVSIEEFIFSCLRLKGNARSIDMVTMLLESKRLYAMVKAYMLHTDKILREVQGILSLLS